MDSIVGEADHLDHQSEHDDQDRHSEHSDHDQNAADPEGSISSSQLNGLTVLYVLDLNLFAIMDSYLFRLSYPDLIL